MGLDNDTRGWIMTAMSGIACVFGASIICVDVLVRLLPGKKHFKIQDSNPFLSSSLSLSFGVMLFSSLYNMLPSAKKSLQQGGFSPKAAAWTLIGCFLAGVVGIQVVSHVLHRYIPSHVVDCDHSHDPEDDKAAEEELHKHTPTSENFGSEEQRWRSLRRAPFSHHHNQASHEHGIGHGSSSNGNLTPEYHSSALVRRPSLHLQLSQKVSQLVSATKRCDESGRCYGYTDPCGQDCFQIVQARGGSRSSSGNLSRSGTLARSVTVPHAPVLTGERQPLLQNVAENAPLVSSQSVPTESHHSMEQSHDSENFHHANGHTHSPASTRRLKSAGSLSSVRSQGSSHGSDLHEHHDHHHHVPTNAFLSIGLQTSIAIALHKLPEGFITYATNHANPRLGVSVFLALFIHNITEGFAMALPLYLAIGSRWKAMFWSSLLGGVSQPLGAGVAALWFHLSGKGTGSGDGEGEGVYGCMFAVTAGIMTSVALQLFSESLDLTHNRHLCMTFAFVGMGILGVSSALTAS